MALFRGNPSGPSNPAPESQAKSESYSCDVPPVTQDTYLHSGSDNRHPMNDDQLSDMINGRNG